MSALKSVIITLPSKSLCANDSSKSNNLMDDSISMDSDNNIKAEAQGWLRGKKRRLDHLTWEEKLQRKKLKNRVAAQTSRDRKKAKLDELEDTVRALRDSNELLSDECARLRLEKESLLVESTRLREQVANNNDDDDEQRRYCSSCRVRVGCVAPTLGSAVSPINPLPQGGAAQPALCPTPSRRSSPPMSTNTSIILKIMTLYLLSRNSLDNSKATTISNDSNNSPRAFCDKLPPRWKQVLLDQMSRGRSKIPLNNLTIQKEWWGRHQKMWKPVQPSKA